MDRSALMVASRHSYLRLNGTALKPRNAAVRVNPAGEEPVSAGSGWVSEMGRKFFVRAADSNEQAVRADNFRITTTTVC
jgi:hypothetical protein